MGALLFLIFIVFSIFYLWLIMFLTEETRIGDNKTLSKWLIYTSAPVCLSTLTPLLIWGI